MNLKFAMRAKIRCFIFWHSYFNFKNVPTALDGFSKNLYSALEESCSLSESSLISLSGGLDSSIIAYFFRHRKPQAVAVIADDFVSTDLTYCQTISKEMQLPLTIFNVETDMILEAIEDTIRILQNFNDIEIRNNVVMYLAIKWAKDNGEKSVLTGDGADELFAGYNFLKNKSEDDLEKEIKRICSIMHFPTQRLGNSLGVKVKSPFLGKKVVELASSIPAGLKVAEENGKVYGKWILRKTFEEYLPKRIVWREKSPMQDGSGTAGLTGLFESVIPEKTFVGKKLAVEKDDGVVIRSRESMHYYEIFKRLHGSPVDDKAEYACPYCKHDVGQSKFCRMCGAFPI